MWSLAVFGFDVEDIEPGLDDEPEADMGADDLVRGIRSYRAGILSVRAIARSFGISAPAILKHAKKQGWRRAELAPRIRQAAQERLAADDKLASSDNLDTTDNQTDNREGQGEVVPENRTVV